MKPKYLPQVNRFLGKLALLGFLFPVFAEANVDVVEWNDTLFVSFVLNYDEAFLYRFGIEFPQYIGEFTAISLSLSEQPTGNPTLLWAGAREEGISDSLILFDPASMSVLHHRGLYNTEFHSMGDELFTKRISLLRYSDNAECCLYSYMRTLWTDNHVPSVQNYGVIVSALIDTSPTGSLGVSDTMNCDASSGWFYHLGPVKDTIRLPLVIAHDYWPGMGVTDDATCVLAFQHSDTQAPGVMDSVVLLYESISEPFSAEALVHSLGSCADKCIGIWNDTTYTVYCSEFGTELEPEVTYPFSFTFDEIGTAAAMSCNPLDTGLLLAWYESGEIHVLHYESEWNQFERIVATGQNPVSKGNIAVCSDVTGYWIAWLPAGATQPEIIYVDRSIVTGIENKESIVTGSSTHCYVAPNPFSSCLSISYSLPGPAEVKMSVYDLSGRLIEDLVRHQVSEGEHTFIWNPDTALPDGCYMIILDACGERAVQRCVRLN